MSKSKYLDFIPNTAIVETIEDIGEPRHVEIIIVKASEKLLGELLRIASDSRARGFQRDLNKKRIQTHAKSMEENRMTSMNVEIVIYKETVTVKNKKTGKKTKDKVDVIILVDGQHKIQSGFDLKKEILLTITVRYASSKESVREHISQFDSSDSVRKVNDVAKMTFSDFLDTEHRLHNGVSLTDIKEANSAINHLTHLGRHGDIESNSPNFTRGKVTGFYNFRLTRDKYMYIVLWIRAKLSRYYIPKNSNNKFSCGHRRLSSGLKATIIQSYAIYGDDVMKSWDRYFTMYFDDSYINGDPMRCLFEHMTHEGRNGGGVARQETDYNFASWAFLSATNRFGLDDSKYNKSAIYNLVSGMQFATKITKARQSKARQKASA